jgi:hypothetical protein
MDMSSLLGDAAPTKQFLTAVVSGIAGHPVTVATAAGEPVPYDSGSPATACLARLRGTTTDGTAWSVFVKVLQHPRHWPGLDRIPPPLRQEFCDQFPWRHRTRRVGPGVHRPAAARAARPGAVPARLALPARSPAARRIRRQPQRPRSARLLPHPPGYGLRRYYDGPA